MKQKMLREKRTRIFIKKKEKIGDAPSAVQKVMLK